MFLYYETRHALADQTQYLVGLCPPTWLARYHHERYTIHRQCKAKLEIVLKWVSYDAGGEFGHTTLRCRCGHPA